MRAPRSKKAKGIYTSLGRMAAILFLAIAVLASLWVGLGSWVRTSRQRTELITSLAVQQPLWIEQITSNALELKEDRLDAQRHISDLQAAAATFEQTLWVLGQGGELPLPTDEPVQVPAAKSPEIQGQVHQIHHTWDTFRGYLDALVAEIPGSLAFNAALEAVERLSPQLMRESEALSQLYEVASVREATRMRWIQGGVLAGAAVLLVLGFLLTQTFVLRPLNRLGAMAEQISHGDLDTPVEVRGPREVEAMARSLETMRTQLKASQGKFLDRAARLEAQVAQHQGELNTAYEFSPDMVAELDTDQLLVSVIDQALVLLRAETARLCLVTANGEALRWVAESGMEPGSTRFQRPAVNQLLIDLLERNDNISPDAVCAGCSIAENEGESFCISAPMRTGEHTFGTLCVARSAGQAFDSDESRALNLLANSAAIAISNVYLLESERRYSEQIASLTERERLAADLHDDLAQTLSYLNLKADDLRGSLAMGSSEEAASEVDDIQKALDRAYAQVRAALIDLRRLDLEPSEALTRSAAATIFSEQLADCLAVFRDTSGLDGELIIVEPSALELPDTVQRQVVHIVREALTNAWRHADANQVSVRVEGADSGDEICFVIEDDGHGFEPSRVTGDGHFGLMVMRARAERSGGRLVIESEPGVGTKILGYFPLDAQRKELAL